MFGWSVQLAPQAVLSLKSKKTNGGPLLYVLCCPYVVGMHLIEVCLVRFFGFADARGNVIFSLLFCRFFCVCFSFVVVFFSPPPFFCADYCCDAVSETITDICGVDGAEPPCLIGNGEQKQKDAKKEGYRLNFVERSAPKKRVGYRYDESISLRTAEKRPRARTYFVFVPCRLPRTWKQLLS